MSSIHRWIKAKAHESIFNGAWPKDASSEEQRRSKPTDHWPAPTAGPSKPHKPKPAKAVKPDDERLKTGKFNPSFGGFTPKKKKKD
jgi:hypothetical protein